MRVYSFGDEASPVIMLLPGTCCHWKGNFEKVIPLLADTYHVLCVSYDGFDETENTEFSTMPEETEKIETYIRQHCGGHIRAAYGCSLGGSFVGLLAVRRNIHMDHGILGSSDLDQSSPFAAKLQTNLLLPLIYPVIRDGRFKNRFLQKRLQKRAAEMGDHFKTNIVGCAMLCAAILSMPRRPGVGELTDYYARATMTKLMKWFCRQSGKSKYTPKDIAAMKATAALKAADRNPYSWNMDFYEYRDGSGYEGRFTKCGICTLMKELELYDLTPAMCHLDYTMSEAGGVTDFVRKYTLASGGPYCDCGWHKKKNAR